MTLGCKGWHSQRPTLWAMCNCKLCMQEGEEETCMEQLCPNRSARRRLSLRDLHLALRRAGCDVGTCRAMARPLGWDGFAAAALAQVPEGREAVILAPAGLHGHPAGVDLLLQPWRWRRRKRRRQGAVGLRRRRFAILCLPGKT